MVKCNDKLIIEKELYRRGGLMELGGISGTKGQGKMSGKGWSFVQWRCTWTGS